jgi:hypothetical protein
MRCIDKFANRIGLDKIIHFLGGWVVYDLFESLWAVFVVATIKELYDEYSYGGFGYWDSLATFLGGVAALVVLIIKVNLL